MAKDDLERAVWDRGFRVTREPKPLLLAAQVLNPCYFRDARRFYDIVAENYSKQFSVTVTADEVEGMARLWADRANLTAVGEVEDFFFPYFDSYAKQFKGWVVSGEAMVIPIDADDED